MIAMFSFQIFVNMVDEQGTVARCLSVPIKLIHSIQFHSTPHTVVRGIKETEG